MSRDRREGREHGPCQNLSVAKYGHRIFTNVKNALILPICKPVFTENHTIIPI